MFVSAAPAQEAEDTGIAANGKASNGYVAQGHALAQSFLHDEQSRAGWLNCYVGQLSEMDTTGRVEFRKALNAHLKAMGEHVKQWAKDTPEHLRYSKAMRSASTRISEMATIAKAMDAGYNPEYQERNGLTVRDSRGIPQMLFPFHTILADARLFLNAGAATGPTKRKGRPPVAGFVKAVRYLAKVEGIDQNDKALLDKVHEFAAQLAIEAGMSLEGGEEEA